MDLKSSATQLLSADFGLNDSADSVSPLYKQLLDNLYDGVYFVNRDRAITYWNKGAERLTGYAATEAMGRHCFDNFLQHVDENGCGLCGTRCPLKQTIEDGKAREIEVYLRHKEGHRVPVAVRASPIMDGSGAIIGAVEIFSDASAKKLVERRLCKLENLAHQDVLTGLANRRYVELRVQQQCQEVEQFGKSVGLLLIDVDHFKHVNDTWGHAAGDRVLQTVSNTLLNSVRPGDTVGRWGGEEFLLILQGDLIPLECIAERCRALVETTTTFIEDRNIGVTISVGATYVLPGDWTSQIAIRRADELLYKSKSSGRNCITIG